MEDTERVSLRMNLNKGGNHRTMIGQGKEKEKKYISKCLSFFFTIYCITYSTYSVYIYINIRVRFFDTVRACNRCAIIECASLFRPGLILSFSRLLLLPSIFFPFRSLQLNDMYEHIAEPGDSQAHESHEPPSRLPFSRGNGHTRPK